jgi:hypothetical protein
VVRHPTFTPEKQAAPSARAYGSEGWGFESLRAHAGQWPFSVLRMRRCWFFDDSFDDLTDGWSGRGDPVFDGQVVGLSGLAVDPWLLSVTPNDDYCRVIRSTG